MFSTVLLPVIPPSRYIQESGAAHTGSWRATIYIDDLEVMVPEHEVDAGVGADLQRRVDACYEAHSLGVKTAKNIDLTSSPMELIGTELRNMHGYRCACVAVCQVHREGGGSVVGVPSGATGYRPRRCSGPRTPAGKLGVDLVTTSAGLFLSLRGLPLPPACCGAGCCGGDRVAIRAAGVGIAASGAAVVGRELGPPFPRRSWSSPRTRVHLEGQ